MNRQSTKDQKFRKAQEDQNKAAQLQQQHIQSRQKELGEIPGDLKKLIKIVANAVYEKEKIVIINCLIHWHCLREADIKRLTQLGEKLVMTTLNKLKSDSFLTFTEMRTTIPSHLPDMKPTRTTLKHWSINYKAIVNVITYRIHKMQVMAEMQSKKSAAKADFHCKNRLCQKEFTGLDMNRLTNFNRINEWGEVDDRLTCDFCGSEVVEDESKKKVDPRQLPKTLNERLKFANDLIDHKLKYITLIPELTHPGNAENLPEKYEDLKEKSRDKERIQKLITRNDENSSAILKNNRALSAANPNANLNDKWRSGSNAAIQFDEGRTSIEILSNSDLRKAKMAKHKAKEVPIWMRQSTIKGAEVDSYDPVSRKRQFDLFLDDIKEDDDFLIDDDDDREEPSSEITNDQPGKKKKPKTGTGQGRWHDKKENEVKQMLREYEKNDDEKNEESDDDDEDSDYEGNNDFMAGGSSNYFSWPEWEIDNCLYRYDYLLKNPQVVDSFSRSGKMKYKTFANSQFNINYMF